MTAVKPGIALREMWKKRYVSILNLIFEEYESNKILVEPDVAMEIMEDLLAGMVGTESQTVDTATPKLRFDFDAYRREAHHYAVDRFYKTYFPRKRGAPPLPDAYLDRILRLRFKGHNYVAIAENLGQSKENMRKQVRIAEKRWRERVAKIEQFKQRFPRSVATVTAAPAPPVKISKQRPSGNRSEHQRAKRTTGK